MKRSIAFLCLLLILALSVGCAAQTQCDFCGKTAVCKQTTYLGHEMNLCDNCYAQLIRE